MTTVAQTQTAMKFRDRWPRGVNYTRELTYRDSAGVAIDLSAYDTISMGAQGPGGVSLDPASYRANFDSARGGAASGAITVFIASASLNVNWPQTSGGVDKYVSRLTWTVKVTDGPITDRPVFDTHMTVFDTAFV